MSEAEVLVMSEQEATTIDLIETSLLGVDYRGLKPAQLRIVAQLKTLVDRLKRKRDALIKVEETRDRLSKEIKEGETVATNLLLGLKN